MTDADDLNRTPLFDLHRELNGRMVDFAGWSLPVRFDPGPVAEHLHTREATSVFDVSHMGVIDLHGESFEGLAAAMETLVPADVSGLVPGRQRYTVFTNEAGGVVDDFIVGRDADSLTLVVNASRRQVDLDLLHQGLETHRVEVVPRDDLALLAVQGPGAAEALTNLAPGIDSLGFMGLGHFDVAGTSCRVTRSGYTGEDGFELQIPLAATVGVARELLALPGVALAGLAARDSLRLEAGLCLYGNDLDETITPIEAGLGWSIPARRRSEGGFPGAPVVERQLANGVARVRVGLRVDGPRPVRAGAELFDQSGGPVGKVTSGGVGPTFGGPIAMGYVDPGAAEVETNLVAVERGRELAVVVTALPFVEARNRRRQSPK